MIESLDQNPLVSSRAFSKSAATCAICTQLFQLHALYRHSSSLRQDRIYLDDLTHQQMEGRRALDTRRLELKAADHKTWWRRDVLHWADDDGVHNQRPSQP